MMDKKRRFAALAVLVSLMISVAASTATPALAHGLCHRAVVMTLPGVTWDQVRRFDPPELLSLADSGATGSMSVRTNSSRTTYASGFASIGAGARVDGGMSTGGPTEALPADFDGPFSPVRAAGLAEMRGLLDEAGYTTVNPGALAEGVAPNPIAAIGNSDAGMTPPVPEGRSWWGLLAAMDVNADVDLACRCNPGRGPHSTIRGAHGSPSAWSKPSIWPWRFRASPS